MSLRCPFLKQCDDRLALADERFEALVASVTPGAAAWRPAPGSWSVAECLDHLAVSAEAYFERMDTAIRHARESGWTGSAPYGRGTFFGRLLLSMLDPDRPKPRKLPAPGVFLPSTEMPDFGAVCERLRSAHRRVRELMAAADGLALGRIKLASPAARWFRLTVAQVFEIFPVHELRHLAQAERVTSAPGFPG